MPTTTTHKKVTRGAELVVVPREEYEEFLRWQKAVETHKIFKPTKSQLKDLRGGREERKRGIYMTIDELKQKLDVRS